MDAPLAGAELRLRATCHDDGTPSRDLVRAGTAVCQHHHRTTSNAAGAAYDLTVRRTCTDNGPGRPRGDLRI